MSYICCVNFVICCVKYFKCCVILTGLVYRNIGLFWQKERLIYRGTGLEKMDGPGTTDLLQIFNFFLSGTDQMNRCELLADYSLLTPPRLEK